MITSTEQKMLHRIKGATLDRKTNENCMRTELNVNSIQISKLGIEISQDNAQNRT